MESYRYYGAQIGDSASAPTGQSNASQKPAKLSARSKTPWICSISSTVICAPFAFWNVTVVVTEPGVSSTTIDSSAYFRLSNLISPSIPLAVVHSANESVCPLYPSDVSTDACWVTAFAFMPTRTSKPTVAASRSNVTVAAVSLPVPVRLKTTGVTPFVAEPAMLNDSLDPDTLCVMS